MEKMAHDYVDIPSLHEPLQGMYWKRQELIKKLGESSVRLVAANEDYNSIITDILKINLDIREEETK
jgi:hypothetical protein